jgi:hypothetical protein
MEPPSESVDIGRRKSAFDQRLGNVEVAGTSSDQYRQTLVLIEFGGEFYWMVGNPEINADSASQNEGKAIVFC